MRNIFSGDFFTILWIASPILLLNGVIYLTVHLIAKRRKVKLTRKYYVKRILYGLLVLLIEVLCGLGFCFAIGYPLQMAAMEPSYQSGVGLSSLNYGFLYNFDYDNINDARELLAFLEFGYYVSAYSIYERDVFPDNHSYLISSMQMFDSEWNKCERLIPPEYDEDVKKAFSDFEGVSVDEAKSILHKPKTIDSKLSSIPGMNAFLAFDNFDGRLRWGSSSSVEKIQLLYPETLKLQQVKELFRRQFEFCQPLYLLKIAIKFDGIQESITRFILSTEEDAASFKIVHWYSEDSGYKIYVREDCDKWIENARFSLIEKEILDTRYLAGRANYAPFLLSFSCFEVSSYTVDIPQYILYGTIVSSLFAFAFLLIEIIGFFNRERKSAKEKLELLSTVAHALKTPMGAASMYAEKIARGDIPEQTRQAAESLLRETNRMSGRLHDLLTFSKMDNTAALNKTTFALDGLLEDVFNEHVPQMEDKDIAFDTDMPRGVKICADKNRIGMAVSNYLSNAVKFTPEGGEIMLAMETRRRKRVRVSVYNSGSHVPKENMEKIWKYLYKTDKGDNANGTGLGLPSTMRIIALHNGRCGAENTNGGMMFWFEVPMG